MPGTIPSTLRLWIRLILTTLQDKCLYPHFTDKKTEYKQVQAEITQLSSCRANIQSLMVWLQSPASSPLYLFYYLLREESLKWAIYMSKCKCKMKWKLAQQLISYPIWVRDLRILCSGLQVWWSQWSFSRTSIRVTQTLWHGAHLPGWNHQMTKTK